MASAPSIPNRSVSVPPANLDSHDFLFTGLSADEAYLLYESHDNPLKPFVIVGISINGRSFNGDDIVLSTGNDVLDIILDRSGVVTGRVRGASAKGSVTARRISDEAPAAIHRETTQTDVVDGRFAFRGLPPGTYVISVAGKASPQTLDVKAGRVVELAF